LKCQKTENDKTVK